VPWFLLVLAILAEVIGTTALKASEGFTRPGAVAVVALAAFSGYGRQV
jgi:small multidrug resistance pump